MNFLVKSRFLLPTLRLALTGLGAAALFIILLPKPHLLDETSFSFCYTDRDGHLLRLGLAEDDRYRVFVPLQEISPQLVEMTLLHEDRFFREHAGFNAVALSRASWYALTGTGPHIGASTITMQLARLHYHLHTRTPWGKFCQVLAAIHLEVHCSKNEILEAYLNTAPYGRNIEGVGAASLIYFGKPPAHLAPEEAMTLAVLPQSPARRAPGSPAHEAALRRAREVLLAQWLVRHPEDARLREVLAMPLQVMLPRDLPFRAPHLVDEMIARQDDAETPRAEVRLTLDGGLQDVLEREISAYTAAHDAAGIHNACALLVDYRTMEVRAAVGSADYRRRDIEGQVDGLRMQRSPGSALKPFIYALALDQGLIHPNSLLRDAPVSFDGYDPENFDRAFAGPIRARDALIQSRNIPAIDLESRLPSDRNLYTVLRDAGVRRLQPQEHYGLTLALGSAEVSPEELAALYASLAHRGVFRPLRFEPDQPDAPGTPLVSPEAAWLTLDMLKDATRPDLPNLSPLARDGRPVAWKTGTSFSYRDAWCAGVFDDEVLVVWVGNFDGSASGQFVGRVAAAPLFFSILEALRAREPAPAVTCFDPDPALNLTKVQLCADSGGLAGPNCPRVTTGWFIPGTSPITACDVHRRVWIDNQTGRRLAGFPSNPAAAHQEICEFWPSEFAKLFREAGLPRPAPPPLADSSASRIAAHTAAAGPRIVSPRADRVYQLRVNSPSADTLDLEASSETARDQLYWFVDSAYLGTSTASTPLAWKPVAGHHTIRAVDELGRADARVIDVVTVE
jgi:penicillin-binding protein 1C